MTLTVRSQISLYTTVLFSCISFAIVLPSLWPYLQTLSATKAFLALVVATYSLGEAIGAVLFGYLTARIAMRDALIATSNCGILGSVMYVTAVYFPRAIAPYVVLIGRFLQGVWTGGGQAVQQTYLTKMLPAKELTAATVTLSSYATFGFVVGPVLGLVGVLIPPFAIVGPLVFDAISAPAFLVLAMALASTWMYQRFLDEQGDEEALRAVWMDADCEQSALVAGKSAHGQREKEGRLLFVGLLVCNFGFCVHFYGFALLETITTPLVQLYYSWTLWEVNLVFTMASVCSLFAFITVGYLSRVFSDRSMTAVTLVASCIGSILLMSTEQRPLPVWRFLCGFCISMVSFPVGRATLMSMYSKLLPEEKQGVGQGVLLAAGAVARMVGPFWAVRAFTLSLGAMIVFGVNALVFFITFVTTMICYESLQTF